MLRVGLVVLVYSVEEGLLGGTYTQPSVCPVYVERANKASSPRQCHPT